MAKDRSYLAQLQVGFMAKSDVYADQTADYLKARVDEHLDEDDSVRVTQVVCTDEPLRPEETLIRLKIARNELVRLRYKDTMSLAQELDKVIWKLRKLVSDDDPLPNDYDYNRIVNIAEALNRGENPLY